MTINHDTSVLLPDNSDLTNLIPVHISSDQLQEIPPQQDNDPHMYRTQPEHQTCNLLISTFLISYSYILSMHTKHTVYLQFITAILGIFDI